MNKSCTGLSLCACCILAACTVPPAIPEPQPEVLPFLPQVVPLQKVQEKNRQHLSALRAALATCVHIDIAHIIIGGGRHTHRCTAAETQELLALLGELHALPFEGSILAQPGQWYVLTFYDANNNSLATVRDWEITHEKAATHPHHCEANATMYLPAPHYARFEQILQATGD